MLLLPALTAVCSCRPRRVRVRVSFRQLSKETRTYYYSPEAELALWCHLKTC